MVWLVLLWWPWRDSKAWVTMPKRLRYTKEKKKVLKINKWGDNLCIAINESSKIYARCNVQWASPALRLVLMWPCAVGGSLKSKNWPALRSRETVQRRRCHFLLVPGSGFNVSPLRPAASSTLPIFQFTLTKYSIQDVLSLPTTYFSRVFEPAVALL